MFYILEINDISDVTENILSCRNLNPGKFKFLMWQGTIFGKESQEFESQVVSGAVSHGLTQAGLFHNHGFLEPFQLCIMLSYER